MPDTLICFKQIFYGDYNVFSSAAFAEGLIGSFCKSKYRTNLYITELCILSRTGSVFLLTSITKESGRRFSCLMLFQVFSCSGRVYKRSSTPLISVCRCDFAFLLVEFLNRFFFRLNGALSTFTFLKLSADEDERVKKIKT